MPTLTVTDIDVGREYRVYAVDDVDENGVPTGTITVHATLQASLVIAEGEQRLKLSKDVILTGAARTRAIALFNDIKAIAKAEENIP